MKIKYIVVRSSRPTKDSLHPHVTLWRKREGYYPEEFRGSKQPNGSEWLSDMGLGDYDSDLRCAEWVKTFDSIDEARCVCPSEIVTKLTPLGRPSLRLVVGG